MSVKDIGSIWARTSVLETFKCTLRLVFGLQNKTTLSKTQKLFKHNFWRWLDLKTPPPSDPETTSWLSVGKFHV